MIYIIAVKIEGKTGLFVDDDGSFLGSENKKEAIGLLPDYKENHTRNYESSMSAVIHQMSFGYHLLEFKDMDEIKDVLKNTTVKVARNISGSANYVELKDDYKPVVAHEGKFLPDEMKG